MIKLNLMQLLLIMMCLLLNSFVHASQERMEDNKDPFDREKDEIKRKVPKQYEQNLDDQCVFCFDKLNTAEDNLIRLTCGHLFHYNGCLLPWFKNKSNMQCPTCKKTVDPNSFDPPLIKTIKEKSEYEAIEAIENNNVPETLHQLDLKDNSPLIWATIFGKTQIVKLLIEKNADVRHQNSIGATALMFAIENDHFDIAKILIQKNPMTFFQKDKNGLTPLMNACRSKGKSNVISLFRSLPDITYVHQAVREKDNLGRTSLMYAATNAYDADLINLLIIHNNANVADEDLYGRTALFYAIANKRDISFWKPLAQNNPQIWDKPDNFGTTPLLQAAKYGNYENVKALVEHGADISNVDSLGKTALMYASQFGDIYFVNYMFTQIQGGQVNRADNEGMTPLMHALHATTPHAGIVKKLIASGANIAYQTESLKPTALMFAISKGMDTKIINQLINDVTVNQRDDQGNTPLLYAVNYNQPQILKSLIAAGADPLQAKPRGLTPLMYAAKRGYANMVINLAQIEGTVNQQDDSKRTALFYAVTFNQPKIKEILILSNADVNHRDKFGKFAILEANDREKALKQQIKANLKKNRMNKK